MKTSISTLAELHKEKQNLKLEIRASKAALVESVKISSSQINNKILKPAQILNIATQKIQDFVGNNLESPINLIGSKTKGEWFRMALPILLPIVKKYLSNRNVF